MFKPDGGNAGDNGIWAIEVTDELRPWKLQTAQRHTKPPNYENHWKTDYMTLYFFTVPYVHEEIR